MLRRITGGLSLLLASPLVARAAFVNNVEHFDGTVKDSATWSEYKDGTGNLISQSDQLFINSANGFHAAYRALPATVGVGGFVQVKARLTGVSTDPGEQPDVFFALNSPPLADRSFEYSDRSVAVVSHHRQGYAFEYTGDGG